MALTLTAYCPHCKTVNSGFTLRGEYPHPPGTARYLYGFNLFFTCNGCHMGVIADVHATDHAASLLQLNGDLFSFVKNHHWRVIIHPRPEATKLPEHLSITVARCYKQAKENELARHYDAAGSMFRKALDVATVEIDSSLADKKLVKRIEVLALSNLITPAMKDWAHEVRLDGNDATHELDEPTPEEISQLSFFTEMFLTYAFTLPKRVAERREQRSQTASE